MDRKTTLSLLCLLAAAVSTATPAENTTTTVPATNASAAASHTNASAAASHTNASAAASHTNASAGASPTNASAAASPTNASVAASATTVPGSGTTAASSSSNITSSPSSNSTTAESVTTATSANTTSTTTASTSSPPANNVFTFNLVFTSSENYTDDLSNSSSAAYKTRVTNTKNQIEPPYKKFPSFLLYDILGFSKGSIVTNGTLYFNKSLSGAPNASQLLSTLVAAIQSGSVTLPINVSSIRVTGDSPAPLCAFSFFGLSLGSLLLTAVLRY